MINASSPVPFVFHRDGGADIQAEVQIWVKKKKYKSNDRPLARLRFDNATQSVESQDINLPNGDYVCVFLCVIREALNGVFDFRLVVENSSAYTEKGDVNTTPAPNDIRNFKSEFALRIA